MPLTDTADVGYGTTITFQSGLLAQIINVARPDFGKRSVIDISHMTVTNAWRKFIPGDLKDPGTLTIQILFETHRLGAYKTAMAAIKETVTVTYPIPAGAVTAGTSSALGFASNFSDVQPLDDKMTATVEVKFSEEPTVVNAA